MTKARSAAEMQKSWDSDVRWAGYQPKRTPTPIDTPSDRKIDGTCTLAGKCVAAKNSAAQGRA